MSDRATQDDLGLLEYLNQDITRTVPRFTWFCLWATAILSCLSVVFRVLWAVIR